MSSFTLFYFRLFSAMRTLFWALFNLSPPPNNIEPSVSFQTASTPIIMSIVECMYASYYVTAVIVLLRMLVAMMTTSYRDIEVKKLLQEFFYKVIKKQFFLRVVNLISSVQISQKSMAKFYAIETTPTSCFYHRWFFRLKHDVWKLSTSMLALEFEKSPAV